MMTQIRGMLNPASQFALPALVLTWSAHLASTAFGDPFGVTVDFVLVAFASLLKLGTWFQLIRLLLRVHGSVSTSSQKAFIAFGCWLASTTAALALLAISRDLWAPVFSNNACRYYFDGDSIRGPQDVMQSRAVWSVSWHSGAIFLTEFLALATISGIHAFVAFWFGVRPRSSLVLALALSELVLIGYLRWSPWVLFDYDFFHGDVLIGALVMDQIPIMAMDPYTSIAIPIYVSLALACYLYLRLDGRGAPKQAAS